MKTDGRLDPNPLKVTPGDAFHALLCAAGLIIRLLMKMLNVELAED